MFLFLSTNFLTSSSLVWLDAAEPWQFGFQSAATPVMEGIINFHNHIMFFLIGVGVFVFWLLFRCLSFFSTDNNTNKIDNFTHATNVEII
jgi:cytochrome c oxidase subunit 2